MTVHKVGVNASCVNAREDLCLGDQFKTLQNDPTTLCTSQDWECPNEWLASLFGLVFRSVQANWIAKRWELSPRRNQLNFLLVSYVTSYFLCTTSFSAMLSEVHNCKYKVNILRVKWKMSTVCNYFSTSFHLANPNFLLRPKLGHHVSLWTEQKTNPKSQVARQCAMRTQVAQVYHVHFHLCASLEFCWICLSYHTYFHNICQY